MGGPAFFLQGLGVGEQRGVVRQGQDEVHHVPDLHVGHQVRVRRHLGAVDPLGDPPVEVDRPPAALVDAQVQIGRAERVAPVVERPGVPRRLHPGLELLELLRVEPCAVVLVVLCAGLSASEASSSSTSRNRSSIALSSSALGDRHAAVETLLEDDLVEELLLDEARPVAHGVDAVAVGAGRLVLLIVRPGELEAEEHVPPAEHALAGRRRPAGGRGDDQRLGRLPVIHHVRGQLLDRVGGEQRRVVLVGDLGLVDQRQLGLAPHAQEDHVVDDLLDLDARNQRLERRHRRAVQAVLDRLLEVVARRLRVARRDGRELELAWPVIPRAGIQKRRRRPVAAAVDPVAMEAVAAIEPVPAADLHLLAGLRGDVGERLEVAVDVLVIRQVSAALAEAGAGGDLDHGRRRPVEVGQRLGDRPLELVLVLQVGRHPGVRPVLHGAGSEGVAAHHGQRTPDNECEAKPRRHASILPTRALNRPTGRPWACPARAGSEIGIAMVRRMLGERATPRACSGGHATSDGGPFCGLNSTPSSLPDPAGVW